MRVILSFVAAMLVAAVSIAPSGVHAQAMCEAHAAMAPGMEAAPAVFGVGQGVANLFDRATDQIAEAAGDEGGELASSRRAEEAADHPAPPPIASPC